MVVDLTAMQTRAARLLTDECLVTRDVDGTDDDVLDPATGLLVKAGPTEVYRGPCLIVRPGRVQSPPEREAGVDVYRLRHRLRLPHDAPPLEPRDQVKVTACRNDPAMVDRTFRVESHPQTSSLRVTWMIDLLEDRPE